MCIDKVKSESDSKSVPRKLVSRSSQKRRFLSRSSMSSISVEFHVMKMSKREVMTFLYIRDVGR